MAVKVLTILSQFRARKNNNRTKLQLMRYKILKMLGNETILKIQLFGPDLYRQPRGT